MKAAFIFVWVLCTMVLIYREIKTEADKPIPAAEIFRGNPNPDIRFISIPHPKYRYVRIDTKLQTIQLNYNNKVINYETEEELNNWLYENFTHQGNFINR